MNKSEAPACAKPCLGGTKAGEIQMGDQGTRKSGWRIPGIRISGKVEEGMNIIPDTLIC
jgi:hypothetical protein